ncbi:MAG: type IV toxin-antitoxin system AbiEi family antitoxin domain-containing protein [Acidimicrobiales bacterium]
MLARTVRRRDLLRSGLDWRDIEQRLQTGELIRIARGVYRLATESDPPVAVPGPESAPTVPQHWLALYARTEPYGAFIGQASAWLRRFDGFDDHLPDPELAVPRHSGVRAPTLHRLTTMPAHGLVHGLRTATPAATLLGLGDRLLPRPGCAASRTALDPVDLVELATEHALRHRLTTVRALAGAIDTCARRTAGPAALRAVLRRRPFAAPPTESYLETRLLQVLRSGGQPEPDRQVAIRDEHGCLVARVDLLLDPVVLEADGVAHHGGAEALARDRTRTNRLHAAGYVVLAFTFDQIEHRPQEVLDTVERVRARARARRDG